MKRILTIALITTLLTVTVILPTATYAVNKTIGKNSTDCMIEYINNFYPNGEIYIIDKKELHIDRRGLANPHGMESVTQVNGCILGPEAPLSYKISNTPYCYVTLAAESIF